MGRETKGKKLQLNIRAADSVRPIRYPRATPARFRSSRPCGELFARAWLTVRRRGNFSSETVAPARTGMIHRQTRDRHAAARFVRKVAQVRDARPAIPATLRSQGKMSASGQCFNPRGKKRVSKGN